MAQLAYWHKQVDEMRQFMNRLNPPIAFNSQLTKVKVAKQVVEEVGISDEEDMSQHYYSMYSQASQDDYKELDENEILAIRQEGNYKLQSHDTVSSVKSQTLKNIPCIKFSNCPEFQKDPTGNSCKFGHSKRLFEVLIEKAKEHVLRLNQQEKYNQSTSKSSSLNRMQQESLLQLVFDKAQAAGREDLAKLTGEAPADTIMKIVELGNKQSPAYISGLVLDDSDEGGRQ
jgi:hypothetical protein